MKGKKSFSLPDIISKTKPMIVFVSIIFVIGLVSAIGGIQNGIKAGGIEKDLGSFFFTGTIISLVIFLLITVSLLLHMQKLSSFISEFEDSNNKISQGISSIQTAENEEIKELAMTRNALCMKLDKMKNKSSIKPT